MQMTPDETLSVPNPISDPRCGETLGEQSEDLTFPLRRFCVFAMHCQSVKVGDHFAGDLHRHLRAALASLLDGRDQLRTGGALEKVTTGPREQ